MDRERWERVRELFDAATGRPAAEREAYLRTAAAADEGLVEEVRALLEEDTRSASILDRDMAHVADELLAAPRDPALPPHAFGPYRASAVLGEGGMGVVYLARREDLGSIAAVKLLRDAWLSPARRERFAAEQRTLAGLVHPSIAQLHDAGTLPDGTPWFVMEYVEGVPLTDYCRDHDTSIEGRLELFRTVCEAVQFAHGQAVIHRDLKPSNILVKADGSVKLLDFGIAKHVESLDSPADPTQTALRLLTPAYAAPEQLRGEPVGIRSDVYSLGVILYELLAQRRPFEGAGPGGVDPAARLARAVERPSSVASRAARERAGRASWADLDVLCLTAMHEEPTRRYATVEALARDVDHYLAQEPLEARPDGPGYRLAKFVRRNRRGVTAAAAALVTIVALVVVSTVRLRAMRDEAREEVARTGRIHRFMLSLFAGGDDDAGPAADLRVQSLLERGVAEARALDQEPIVQAELYRTLGTLHQALGDFDQAETLIETALERQRRLLGEKSAQTAETRLLLGLLRTDQARYEEGEQLVREGLDELRTALGRTHPSVARATAYLGRVLEARGDYEAAISVDEEAVRLCAASGVESPDSVTALTQLANSHYYAGHYDAADEMNERVLEATRRIWGEHHPRVADALINVGASLADRGRFAEAEGYDRQALDILASFYGQEHYRTASARTMLGRLFVSQQRFDEGVPLLESALSIQERVHGEVHPQVASTLNDLGSAALQQGRLDEADACFRRMLAIYDEVYPEGHALQGIALSNLASVLMAREEYAAAEEHYRRAIEVWERTSSPTHLNTGIGRIKLGRALLRQGRFADAERESRAGYEIVAVLASPGVSWLRSAREDLVAAYEALGEPERADAYR